MSTIYFPTVMPFHPARLYAPDIFRDGSTIIVLEKGSCTHRAASMFLEQGALERRGVSLKEVKSFEPEGIDLLRKGSGDQLMLVPLVHEVHRTLAFDSAFEHLPGQDFALDNPPIYLATKEPPRTASEIKDRRVAAIKPTDQFLGNQFFEIVPVNSTQEAANLAARRDIPFCITNEIGVKKHDLRIVKQLAHFPMWWQFFKRSSP